jgi:hypothetical protein
MTECSTFANLATHFCTEYPHDDIDRDGLMRLFKHAPMKKALTHSSTANDFVAKARAANDDTAFATQVEALCTVVAATPDAYIKLRSMNLTQQLMDAMPPGVRESINRMTSQLLQTIGPTTAAAPPVTPDATPAADDAIATVTSPESPRTPHPSPSCEPVNEVVTPTRATAPAQMLSSIMQSGMFQEMSDMMKTEMDDQHNVTDKVTLLEEKVNLLWDRIDRLEKRASYKRGQKKSSAPRQLF